MHLPNLSPTALAGKTSSGDSMDDDSSNSVMGYGNPYLASGMSREIGNNLTQDPDAAYRYVGKLNAQRQDSNGWKMDKLCDSRSNDSPGLGDWLAEEEGEREPEVERNVEYFSAEENADEVEEEKLNTEDKLNTDDEDKFSTEEDAKYSEEFDSSTEGTGRESADEEGAGGGQDAYLPEADFLSPAWLDPKIPSKKELQPRRKLLWDSGEEGSLGQEEHWSGTSNGEAEPSHTESEEDCGTKPEGAAADASSGSPRACPVLCFDEYGNLTTSYQDPGQPPVPELAPNLIPLRATGEDKCSSPPVDSSPSTPPVQEPKVLRPRTRISQENSESAAPPPPTPTSTVVSEQELQQAFKEEFNTAATSRYGRARKRKTVDGFFFGTINFNELRKITSGSPKKASKGTASKNTSPDQKYKTREETRPSPTAAVEAKDLKDLNENGIRNLDVHPINGEAEMIVPPLETVQMDQAKDSTFIVQNRDLHTREERTSRRRCRSLETVPTTTSVAGTEGANPDLAQEMAATLEATTAKGTDGRASSASVQQTTTLSRRKWQGSRPGRRQVRTGYLQGRLSARAALKDSQVVPRPRSHRSSRSATALALASQVAPPAALQDSSQEPISEEVHIKEEVGIREEVYIKEEMDIKEEPLTEDMIKKEPTEESQQDMFLAPYQSLTDGQEGPATLTRSRRTSYAKAAEEKASSITKSGRVIKKPQLIDISVEDKRQRQTREQQRQNEALINSSLEEELTMSSVNMQVLEKEHPCEYMVGDLVWVHIRGSPLWPSMISYDPVLGQYSRVATKLNHVLNRYRGIRMYHVQFFSDNSLTHWMAPNSVIPYEGYDKLKEYLQDLKAKMKETTKYKRVQYEGFLRTLLHMNKVPGQKKRERWMKAIDEANVAMEMDRYERIQKYTFKAEDVAADEADTNRGARLSSRYHRGGPGQTTNGQPEKKRRGRPKKSSLPETANRVSKTGGDSTDGEFSGFDDLTAEAIKQNRIALASRLHRPKEDFMTYARQHLDAFMQDNPGISEEAALTKLRWRWRKLTSGQGGRYKGAGGKRKHHRGGELSNGWDDEEGSSGSNSGGGSAKRQRLEEDGGRGVYKVVRNEKVCCRCEGVSSRAGADMVRCKGLCCGVFHLGCLGLTSMPRRDFKCEECLTERHPCFICKSSVGPVQRCTVPFCGKFYHDTCIHRWPQVSRQRQQEKFVCPRHICHMCAANADDIGDSLARTPPFTRCLRCPTTYHTGEGCLAAGTEEVSQTSHICTKHLQLPKNISHHVNVNWCFCCSKGGSLLLCDQCPAAFHAECMKITTPEGGYVCEDCENGKFPVYGDVVWVKLGLYRWWPGQVLHPRFIPDNIENLPHQQGMFCVHFFGSNDYYWVTRGRAFLYQEGDKGSRAQSSRTLEIQFRRAVDEALEAYKEQKAKRNLQELRWSEKGNLKPPPYVRLDANRPVGNVRLSKVDLAAVNRCDCEPNSENPCGSDEKCLNRMLMFECMREVCGAGDRCGNQRFQKKKYPNVCCFKTEDRGWGLKTLDDIKKGEFVIEYVGELIDDEEFRRRIEEMHDIKEENYYFLTIDKDIMIDAGPKGNLARFMNHSCQPNCETQKWTVGGDTRVGLFAIEDITAGSELTFNYNLQCVGTEKKRCCCGAPNCSGFIGVKVQKAEMAGPKREKNGKQRRKRRRRETKVSEDECFRCGGPGDLILCDGANCPKGYHLECLGLDKLPRGKWICPWHHCDECGQLSTRLNRCQFCPNSFCRQHITSNLQLIPGFGNVCQDHDTEELETLRGQMETTALTENMEGQDQQKSDVDSDCRQDSMLPHPSCPEARAEDQGTSGVVEKGQEGSEDHLTGSREGPHKPKRKASRSRWFRVKRRSVNRSQLPNLSRRNRVNGALVQGKERGAKEGEEKARHINEA
ncbi:histone-lysine N-methyltransferase NSD2-like isoform X4 [Portunus trituberculatus]|nr:histone-lysine N-methyltransferase NSD2-like isoform X4 [Portunus trituberculatus]